MQVSASPKSKFVDPSLNILCCGWVKLDAEGKCPKCHKVWKREVTFDSLRKRFEVIIGYNRKALDHGSMTEFQFDNIIIPIKISNSYYAIPFRILKEFDDITSYEKHKQFFMMIQSSCKRIQFP